MNKDADEIISPLEELAKGSRKKNGYSTVRLTVRGGGTVGQDVDELIYQSERKMQQNAKFYL